MKVFGLFSPLIGNLLKKTEPLLIDLGSSHTRISVGGKKIYTQPTCIAVHKKTDSVVAFGEKALRLLGKTPESIEISFPIVNGEIAHTRYLEFYMTAFLDQILPELKLQKYLFGLSAKIAIPSATAPAKKALLQQVLKRVGFTKITFIGSGSVVAQNISKGQQKLTDVCVLDIGAQKAEISIFSFGELTYFQSYRWGGVLLTESLQKIIRTKHHCVVSWHVAESVKKEIGSIVTSKEKVAIRGKDLVTQSSKTVIIDANDVKGIFSQLLDELLDNIMQFIALLPSEVAVSVLEKGIYITGGTSQIQGIDQAVVEKFKCDVLVSTQPETDVITSLAQTKV